MRCTTRSSAIASSRSTLQRRRGGLLAFTFLCLHPSQALLVITKAEMSKAIQKGVKVRPSCSTGRHTQRERGQIAAGNRQNLYGLGLGTPGHPSNVWRRAFHESDLLLTQSRNRSSSTSQWGVAIPRSPAANCATPWPKCVLVQAKPRGCGPICLTSRPPGSERGELWKIRGEVETHSVVCPNR